MDATWKSLAREAALSAEHLSIGVTALGKANYAQDAYYAQAFFALSVGIERTCKLGIVVDYAIRNGAFPDTSTFRPFGHDLQRLISKLEDIGRKLGTYSPEPVPSTDIHLAIVELLSKFARNVTRYFNLEVIAPGSTIGLADDPIASWYNRVTVPVLDKHLSKRRLQQIEADAVMVHEAMDSISYVMHTAEDGTPINRPFEGAIRTGLNSAAKPWERMYVLQIARFIGNVLSELGYAGYSQRRVEIPHMSEFYGMFNNDDRYFRSRKVWSIYGG